MRLRDFVRRNKDEIDVLIRGYTAQPKITNEQRADWVNNVEYLYFRWKSTEGKAARN